MLVVAFGVERRRITQPTQGDGLTDECRIAVKIRGAWVGLIVRSSSTTRILRHLARLRCRGRRFEAPEW